MSDFSPGEAGGVFAGLIALLAMLGKAISKLMDWKGQREESKAARLRAWEENLDKRDREHRAELESELNALRTAQAEMGKRLQVVTGVLLETVGEIQLLDPKSAVLAKVRHVLQQAYPVDNALPPEIATLLRRTDNKDDAL